MKRLLLALAVACALPTAAAAQNPFTTDGNPVVFGRSYELSSNKLSQVRRVNVLLPDGYDDPKNANVRYPVLYLLDGGAGWQDFVHIAGMVAQGGLWGSNAPTIVVGIESKDRRAEFTQPSADPREQKDFPTHGKAGDFRHFLTDELKPAIDAAYRTDGTDGLIGESLAGLFVLETALRHGAAFDRYIAVSPSLWWDGGRLSHDAAKLLAAPNQPTRTIWLALANEADEMKAGVERVVAALRTAPRQAITWTYAPYPSETHGTVYHPAATRAIRDVFPASPAPVR